VPVISRRTLPALGAGLLLVAGCADAQTPATRDTTPVGVSVRLAYDPNVRPGVAVLPVGGVAGDSVRAILQRDLDFGDRVSVLTGRAADAPALPGGRVSYDLARTLGALAVVQAQVTPTGLRVTLHDVVNRKALAARDYVLPPPVLGPAWRLAVHGASDETERWITGVRGIAATRVAFVRDRRVWLVDADGENAQPISERGALSPTWHPSGTAIVHGTLDDAGAQRIVARALGGGSRVLAQGGTTNITPVVSPDGQSVVYAHGQESGTDLFAVPFGGGATRRVTVGRGSDNVSPPSAPTGGGSPSPRVGAGTRRCILPTPMVRAPNCSPTSTSARRTTAPTRTGRPMGVSSPSSRSRAASSRC
jgi:TolB protein